MNMNNELSLINKNASCEGRKEEGSAARHSRLHNQPPQATPQNLIQEESAPRHPRD